MKTYALLVASMMMLGAQHLLLARGGGGSFAGALGGSLMGSMVGSAIANGHSSSSAEQVRIDQERQRVNQLEREMDRRDVERRVHEVQSTSHGSNTLFMVLVSIVIVLLFGVLALGILVLRNKH